MYSLLLDIVCILHPIIPFPKLPGSSKTTRSKPAGPASVFPHPPSHTRTDAAARPVRELQGPPVRQNTGPTLVKKKAAAKCEPSFNFNAVLTWLQSQCLDHVLEHEISPCT